MTGADVCVVAPGDPAALDSTWVVFAAPDAAPARGDLRRIAAASAGDALVVAQPRRGRVARVDLEREPGALDLDGAVLAFRTDVLRRNDLQIEAGVGVDVSGPLLAAEYLAIAPSRAVVVVPAPRLDAPLADWREPARYTVIPHRYAELLARAHADLGSAPRWLAHLVLGQILRYLRENARLYTPTAALAEHLSDAFFDGLAQLLAHVDDATIASYPADGITHEMRLALILGVRQRTGHARPTLRRDRGRGLVRVSYPFVGDAPAESVTLDGLALKPHHHKVRTVDIMGRVLLRERIMWVPDGATVEVERTGEVAPVSVPRSSRLARYRRIASGNSGLGRRVVRDARIRLNARRSRAKIQYRDAWLLMDRDTSAQDNAEHLYRYLLGREPDVNAFFVLNRDSRDWSRLADEGFRLLEFGSDEHFVALLLCAHVVSSQVDDYVIKPLAGHALGRSRWRFTFLQHGVIEHDMSRWLNRKAMDLFITSIPDEHRSIVADESPYVFTGLETVMTGLARHDRLLRIAGEIEPTWLVIMPTWRGELLGPQAGGNRRELVPDFWESGYARAWRALLESEQLLALCQRMGWQLTFVPHPNMQDYLATSPLPAHVVTHRFDAVDVQEVIARSAVLVSDYSSLAMEAALLTHPVVYYQFDRDTYYSGRRLHRPGDWSFERNGFGPVTETVEQAVTALELIAETGEVDPMYLARMQAAFPFRDGRCCERIVAAIRAITQGEDGPH